MKILICGLPGSGKTTLARELSYHFCLPHINADAQREFYDNWDFSETGRLAQAWLMSRYDFGILDFVAPLEQYRNLVKPNCTIFMNTIDEGRYENTNKIFEQPLSCDFEVKQWIELNQLRSSLEGFNLGIEGIQSYLKEQFPKLVK